MNAVEVGATRTLASIGRDLCAAVASAEVGGLTTPVTRDGQPAAAVTPLASQLAAALTEVNRAQASARSHMPDGTLGDFPTNWERRALRDLANEVRRSLGQPRTDTA